MRTARAAWLSAALAAGCAARASAPVVTDGGDDDDAPSSAEAGAPDASADVLDAPAEATDAAHDYGLDCTSDAGHPVQLGCTGLYDWWPTRTVAHDVRAYAPAVALWSDGAEKTRWIRLPPGTQIDTWDMDEWTFPVGTKLWKQFRVGARVVETRFLWKRAAHDWLRTTYVWSSDGASAAEWTKGVVGVDGTPYEIPSQSQCTTCHKGRADGVLGFEAVGLSMAGAKGLTLPVLLAEGLVTDAPRGPIVVPGGATESAALAWLHANCGNACHNRSPASSANDTGLFMRLDVATLASVKSTDAWQTAVGQPSSFQPWSDANMVRIAPRDVPHSAVWFRADTRDDQGQGFQMPPIATHVVDAQDVATIADWINAM